MAYFFLFIIGICFGSFLNAWVWRLAHEKSVMSGRSLCPHCQQKIFWYDNIPILSFCFLKGRCRYCQQKISWLYPITELWLGLMFIGVGVYYQVNTSFEYSFIFVIRDCCIIFFLTGIFLYDWLCQKIADLMTLLPACVLFIVSGLIGWQSWSSMVIGVLVGGGFFLLQYLVSKGRWIGGGDIRLGVFMGVVLGFPNMLVAFLLAYIIGAIIGLGLVLLKKKTMTSTIPFGIFLTVTTLISMYFGEQIITWYLNLL